MKMIEAIGVIALICFGLATLGAVTHYDNRQYWDGSFAVIYLAISAWCFS